MPFPGGTSVSHLTVYDWSGPGDGLPGGSPHMHLACTEGYVVVGGFGRVQTLSGAGFQETPLSPLTVAWFSPGVIHRLVNDDDLRIVVIMGNGGLPEAGDAVLTFPPEHLADRETYAKAASLAHPDKAYASGEDGARERRNLAVRGFHRLREQVEAGDDKALDEFYAAGAALVADRIPRWREVWESGARAAAEATGEHLDALARGDHSHLHAGRIAMEPPPSDRRFGMCGRLATYDL